jgi:hypothetical protein
VSTSTAVVLTDKPDVDVFINDRYPDVQISDPAGSFVLHLMASDGPRAIALADLLDTAAGALRELVANDPQLGAPTRTVSFIAPETESELRAAWGDR